MYIKSLIEFKNPIAICKNGNWKLAPAYDLTPSYGFNGQHTTTINGKGLPEKQDMYNAGMEAGIGEKQCKTIYNEVYETLVNCKIIHNK
jgi:serine/threonine-protein kinase HipA